MGKPQGIEWFNKLPVTGVYTVVAGDDSAGEVAIDTGKVDAEGFMVQVYRAGVFSNSDVKVTLASGVLTVEDGSTFALTTNDVVYWMVF